MWVLQWNGKRKAFATRYMAEKFARSKGVWAYRLEFEPAQN